ncbi:hypothetical protein FLONG3_2964 [Fusarium longipes]|uniref:DUF6604 domain-containing protein n=1 Tax=Fusarium longipes TaxID=694270 RepID=A0A395T2X4_9HYPO|nr:hypothetical protein FLONG3_2964 [Fusarium longipes]
MLPETLLADISQYNADTNSVAAFLASTARICGYKCERLDDCKPSVGGRLKGKARKEAKSQKAEPTKQPPNVKRTKYTVALREFVPMAECIAKSQKPLITVPSSFVSTIDRAIRLRSTFANQMMDHGLDTDLDADSTYDYFVGILKGVREALHPRFPYKEKTQRPQSSKEDLPQGFHALTVEEPSEDFANSPDIERPQQAPGDNTDYEAEEAEAMNGTDQLVWSLLLIEVKSIRDQIDWVWQRYLDNSIDITAAAVATNTGIQMGIRNIMDTGNCPDDLFAEFNSSFLYAFHLITPLVEQTQDSFVFFRPGKFDCQTAGDQIKKVDMKALYEYWVEGVLFLHYNIEKRENDGFPIEDEFLRILRKTNQTNEASLEMAFAAQIFLDIRHLLGSDTIGSDTIGSDTMANKTLASLSEMMDGIKQFVKKHDKSHPPSFIDPVRPQIAEGLKFLERLVFDMVPEVRAYHIRNGLDVEGAKEPWRFYKRLPVLCGLALFHARAEPQDKDAWRLDVTDQPLKNTAFRQAVQGMDKGGPVSSAYLRVYKQRGDCVDLMKKDVYDIASLSKYKLAVQDGQYVFVALNVEEKQQLNERAFQSKLMHTTRQEPWSVSNYLILLTYALVAEARELAFPYMTMHNVCDMTRHYLFERCKRVMEEEVLFPGAITIYQPNDMMVNILWLVDWPGGDPVLKEAAAVIRVIRGLCDDGELQGRIQHLKSFSKPVPVPSVIPKLHRIWYLGHPDKVEPRHDDPSQQDDTQQAGSKSTSLKWLDKYFAMFD